MRARVERSEEWWDEAARRYLAGCSLREITEVMGGGESHLADGLYARGVPIRRPGRARIALDEETILERLAAGATIREVASEHRVSVSPILRIMRDAPLRTWPRIP